SVPSFRVDLKREVDLIEEVARLHGVEKIPSTPPRGAIGANEFDAVHDQIAEARRILTGLGLNEAQGQTLISEKEARLTPEPVQVFRAHLLNPLSSDLNTLRPSLIPGLINSFRVNALHGTHDVRLFEVGKRFLSQPGEERCIAMGLTG